MEDQIINHLSTSTHADLLVHLEALWGSKGSSKLEASSVQGINSLFLRLEQVRVLALLPPENILPAGPSKAGTQKHSAETPAKSESPEC